MKFIIAILSALPLLVYAQEEQYCDKGQRKEEIQSGHDARFCFGTKEYMEAFASSLSKEGIDFHVYKNGDISYRSVDRDRVQEIGDTLLYEYILTRDGKVRKEARQGGQVHSH